MKKIYRNDLSLTQKGELVWTDVKGAIQGIFGDWPDCNPMEVRELVTSALMLESSRRIIEMRRKLKKKAEEKKGWPRCHHGIIVINCLDCKDKPEYKTTGPLPRTTDWEVSDEL